MLYIVRCLIYIVNNILGKMKTLLQKQIGSRIKDLRAKEGISQETFALRIQMDRTYLASIEAGCRNVTLQNLAKISSGFGLTLEEFFQGIPFYNPNDQL